MKLQDAIRQMKPGDKFRPVHGMIITVDKDNIPMWACSTPNPVKLTVDNLDLEGQIIKPEPEVLTADEWYEKKKKDCGSCTCCGALHGEDMGEKGIYRQGDKNGQNKEYKRLKPLIDAVLDNEDEEVIDEIARDLKPPWEHETNENQS